MRVVAFDVETAELQPDGTYVASTEAYRDNFRVTSCAFSWRDETGNIVSRYVEGEEAIQQSMLELLPGNSAICHNAQFEKMVTLCRFADVYNKITWHADTMRLVQCYDNGEETWLFEELPDMSEDDVPEPVEEDKAESKKVAKAKSIGGVGLAKAVQRLLKEPDPKARAYKVLRDLGVKKGKEGANLHLLPVEEMEAYNLADAVNTLRLYEFCTEDFTVCKYDWSLDHRLYMSTVDLLVQAKIKGVPVDRDKAQKSVETVTQEIDEIERAFKQRFESDIRKVERNLVLKRIRKLKTLRGRKNYLRRLRSGHQGAIDETAFNVGSNQQLAMLFVDVLGIQPKFLTDSGLPSFRSAVLGSYGDGGLMLGKRRKRMIVLAQLQALLRLSEYDGRWHLDIKAAGTSTGRMAGGKQ